MVREVWLLFPGAFLCNVRSTSTTLLFSDKAGVYKRHFLLIFNECSTAQWLGVHKFVRSAALVLGFILVEASHVTCI